MAMKPIDLQVNILQMDNASQEIQKQKKVDVNQQNYAASLIERESIEGKSKVEKTDKIQSTIPATENEKKDERKKEMKHNKKNKESSKDIEEDKDNIFTDPDKGMIIDIRE
ncbi:MAG TPA: hypothetical protein PKW55_05700 [Spirochaetota bacterium]|nr:hypothetical protein [Spirochaetota bacterium]HOM37554.1 hypothetical protein [Spirochaetota bacterium]HPQ49474.1 hypothetical protein [Spirochaetota bacterium]